VTAYYNRNRLLTEEEKQEEKKQEEKKSGFMDMVKAMYQVDEKELEDGGADSEFFSTLKHALISIAILPINPLLALMVWFVNRRVSKTITDAQKERLLDRLSAELETTDAKIKDLEEDKGESAKQARYKLIEVKHKLEWSINKIKGYKAV
jgi:hypothetical protein